MRTTAKKEDFMLADEFCELMGWKIKTLYSRVSSGADLPPSIKVGRERIFRRTTVDAWLQRCEKNTALAGVES